MKLNEAKKIITDVFEHKFDKDKFSYFIRNLLKELQIAEFSRTGAYIPRQFNQVVSLYERIGKYEDEEGNLIDVLIVKLKKEHSIDYARTTQRNFIRWYLNDKDKDAALVAFHSENSSDWRFSFVKLQYSLAKGKDEFTPAKRSSFLVGEKGKSHTAQQQFINLLKNDSAPYLSDLEDAFNIETVSDEFFEKYKEQLFNLKEEIDKIVENDPIVKNEFNDKKIDTLNFAKKLLGQIVFLYFLQKKGWLGLSENQKYGEGNRNFMRDLFEQAKSKGENFFNDYLEFLFYDALSQKRPTDFYEKFNCRIPFLNGGLFDPINFYDWQKTDIVIPNELFSNKIDEEEGTGILDTFDLYNFTVKEDEPLEKEVAIDPEMLGKVFERMLNVKDRKNLGAFYTPREIVHYMAQQSLLYYLLNFLNTTLVEGCREAAGCSSPLAEGCRKATGCSSPLTEGCREATGCSSPNFPSHRGVSRSDGVFKKYKQLPYNPDLKERAKELRKAGILSEVIFWNAVKNKQFLGLDFHRQKIIGNYIVDFFCPELNLVVEIDGSSHDFKGEYDIKRENYLKSLGLNIIHFHDKTVKNDIYNTLNELEIHCLALNTPSLPDGKSTPLQEGKNTPSLPDGKSTPLQEGSFKKDLEIFIHFGENVIDKDIALADGKYSEKSNEYNIPESIRKNADLIDKALENIKICDPAVGSGAFPVGVMNEIVKLRKLLTPFVTPCQTSSATPLQEGKNTPSLPDGKSTPLQEGKRTAYHFKANAIENSIYGVDIDAGAVEIAKLRLWLSMVVDEDRIHNIDPLPNLEYKIVCGNSLINMPENSIRDFALENEITELTKHYYKITDKEEKQRQKQIIDNKIQKLLKSASDWAGYEIDFDFKLYFHEVFNKKGGFDVVIGNPPYIQLQKAFDETRKYADLYKNLNFKTFERTGDIYALFYEKGLEILRQDGYLCYITSNKWMRANYGKSLRKFFAKFNPKILIDLGPDVFTTATVDTNILLIQKSCPENINLNALSLKEKIKIDSFDDKNFVVLNDLSEESWIICSKEEMAIKKKIEKIGTPLKDWDISIYRGVLTGFNEAFIIDGKKKDELIAADPRNAEIIKPILRGRDIKKYSANFADLWLIATFPALNINIDDYPVIKEYLEQFLPKIKQTGETFIDESGKKQKTRKKTGNKWFETQDQISYYKEFEKEKIVYPDIAQSLTFILDKDKLFMNNTCYFLNFGIYNYYILSILNTKLIDWYFRGISAQLGNKAIRHFNIYIEQIPVPKISEPEQQPFVELVDKILEKKKDNPEADTSELERKIDELVYELYELTDEEIKIIES